MPDHTSDPLSGVQSGRPGAISFVLGLPDPSSFAASDLSEAARVGLAEHPEVALQYAPEQGYGRLIDFLIEKWRADEGHAITRANLTLSAGSTDAVNLLAQLLAGQDATVLVEGPSYRDTLHLFRDHRLQPVSIPVDAEGLNVDELEVALDRLRAEGRRPAFLYTIPSFQNPTGTTLSLNRRRRLLALADHYDLTIVADDVYKDIWFDAPAPPALGALDPTFRHVITIGSFSKTLAAGLRLGWVIAGPEIVDRLVGSGVRAMGGGANPFVAHVVAAYCRAGKLEPHVVDIRTLYRQRRDAMLGALERFMPPAVRWSKPGGGFFIWLTLPPGMSARECVRSADRQGVTCLAGSAFFAHSPDDDIPDRHIRLAFSYVPPERIEQGIRTMAEVIRDGGAK